MITLIGPIIVAWNDVSPGPPNPCSTRSEVEWVGLSGPIP